MSSLFCRHNRFTADCPICSKGTLLDPERAGARRGSGRSASGTPTPKRSGPRRTGARSPGYPSAEVGPYVDEDGQRYVVRLERVPGGLRLAEWSGGEIRRRAPRLASAGLPSLVESAAQRGVLDAGEAEALRAALGAAGGPLGPGASPGRAGDLRDELRLEALEDGGLVRVARWMLRPGTGWELREAPVMLPAARYVEALCAAAAPEAGGG
ncbi:MAG: hypothetical protein ACR2LY_07060 [Thermoleophilaceae bacterium]